MDPLSRSLDDIISDRQKEVRVKEKKEPKPQQQKKESTSSGPIKRGAGQRVAAAAPTKQRLGTKKLYIGTFSRDVSDSEISSLFTEDFIRVKEVELFGSSGRQYLVASFERYEEAEAAVNALGGKRVPFASRPLVARPYEERDAAAAADAKVSGGAGDITVVKRTSAEHPANRADTKVNVFNLPYDLAEGEMRQVFQSVGRVTFVYLEKRADGKSLGKGHVVFADGRSADKAVAELHGALVNGREIRVERA